MLGQSRSCTPVSNIWSRSFRPNQCEDLGEYQRKFLKIAHILINGRKLSDLDQDALFLSGLPADLETQVRQHLLITKSTDHPSDPYPIADIIEATQFLFTSSALCPLLAAPVAGTPTAQPYYLAWAAPVPTPVAPRTATPTAASAIKQEQINLQCTARQDCAFCADPSHFMGSCPLVEGYIQAGKASRGTDSRLYLPDSWHIPHIQDTRCLCKCLDWCKDDRMAGRTKGVRHTCPEPSKGRGKARYFAPKGTQGKGGVGRKSKAEELSAKDSLGSNRSTRPEV